MVLEEIHQGFFLWYLDGKLWGRYSNLSLNCTVMRKLRFLTVGLIQDWILEALLLGWISILLVLDLHWIDGLLLLLIIRIILINICFVRLFIILLLLVLGNGLLCLFLPLLTSSFINFTSSWSASLLRILLGFHNYKFKLEIKWSTVNLNSIWVLSEI